MHHFYCSLLYRILITWDDILVPLEMQRRRPEQMPLAMLLSDLLKFRNHNWMMWKYAQLG